MRILFISNFFPPFQPGWGYMQLCEEVAEGLTVRGHQLAVLTSQHRDAEEISRDYPVYRGLLLDPDWQKRFPAAVQFFVGRRRREQKSLKTFLQIIQRFNPEAIVIWNGYGIPRQLFKLAEELNGVKTAYYLANYLPEDPDEYIAYWQNPPQNPNKARIKQSLTRIALRQLNEEGKPIELRYENAMCVSAYLRERLISQGLIPDTAVVIHNGIDLKAFKAQRKKFGSPELKLLIAGRITEEKGVHTAIEAMAILIKKGFREKLSLTLLGNGEKTYIKMLQKLIDEHDLGGIVHFAVPVCREKMPEILDQYDVLILPSVYAEPLARSAQEAMAMGLLVIGTDTGGSVEIIKHEKTGLIFPSGEEEYLAHLIQTIIDDIDKIKIIACQGQQLIQNNFDIHTTILDLENYLIKFMAVVN
jgi:glycogen(starch) synthase